HATLAALALVERGLAELVADVFQRCVAAVAGDREHRLEGGMQAALLALAGGHVLLQELAVRVDLDGQQEGHLEDGPALADVLADALLFGEGVGLRQVLGSCGHGVLTPRYLCGPRARGPGMAWNCQLEVAGIAGTSTPSPATSD